jgi:hypothetical protein
MSQGTLGSLPPRAAVGSFRCRPYFDDFGRYDRG